MASEEGAPRGHERQCRYRVLDRCPGYHPRDVSLPPGTRFGPYQVQAPLGAGGMGEVYRARDTRLNRDVAIKVLPGSLSGDAGRLQRFEQEARAASALNHPNILVVHDIGSGSAEVPRIHSSSTSTS